MNVLIKRLATVRLSSAMNPQQLIRKLHTPLLQMRLRSVSKFSLLPILEKLTGTIVYGGQHNGQNLKITVFLRIRQRNLLRLRLL